MKTTNQQRETWFTDIVKYRNAGRLRALGFDPSVVESLIADVDELQACAESAEQERDKLRAALEHAESHIQEMENAEGRAFFADTAAMAKKLGEAIHKNVTP